MRTLQVSQLLEALQSFCEANGEGAEVPIIVCGDFNDEPNSQSCHLMRMNTPFRFLSIWDFKVETTEESSPVTTFKWRPAGLNKRIIDYVWYPLVLPPLKI